MLCLQRPELLEERCRQIWGLGGAGRATDQSRYGQALIESDGDKVKSWRQDVRDAAIATAEEAGWQAARGPITVDIICYLARPKGHYRTGRYADLLPDVAPTFHTTKPDKNKLERATNDALTSSGVIIDDSNIVGGSTWKQFADTRTPGAHIIIRDLQEHTA